MKPPLRYSLYAFLWTLVDWLFPPTCPGCEQPWTRWCDTCQDTNLIRSPYICYRCGNPVDLQQHCLCWRTSQVLKATRSSTWFEPPLQQAIHQFKYAGDLSLADSFAVPMIRTLKALEWKVDLVVPVPLHKNRFKKRGFNQSAMLALPIALALGLKFSSKAIQRIRDTEAQVNKTPQERLKNMDGAFKANPAIVQGKKVLVIDDVMTTGATLNACAIALIDAGALEVFGLTLSQSTYHRDTSHPPLNNQINKNMLSA